VNVSEILNIPSIIVVQVLFLLEAALSAGFAETPAD
jgi:hypothetical protein